MTNSRSSRSISSAESPRRSRSNGRASAPRRSRPGISETSLKQFRALARKALRIINSKPTKPKEFAAQLQAYYRLGQGVARFVPKREAYYHKIVVKLAEIAGCGRDLLYKVRSFALMYSGKELREVSELSGRIRWNHVVRLLAVRRRPTRQLFHKRIAAKNLSVDELARELKVDSKGRKRSGRDPKRPRSPRAALVKMIELCRTLSRQCERTWLGVPRRKRDRKQDTQQTTGDNDQMLSQVGAKLSDRASAALTKNIKLTTNSLTSLIGQCESALKLLDGVSSQSNGRSLAKTPKRSRTNR